jgi:hypothetical protein
MPPAKLKVFRTPIGFHDAYIAAPTKKAAIEAWGTDKTIFQRGEAEEVTDPSLMADALASPGTVIKKLRGTAEEQIEALGRVEPAARPPKKGAAKNDARKARTKATPKPPPKPKPRPSRDKLDAAEAALGEAEARHREERRALARREAELAKERREISKRHEQEAERLERQRDKARAAYEAAMTRWRG